MILKLSDLRKFWKSSHYWLQETSHEQLDWSVNTLKSHNTMRISHQRRSQNLAQTFLLNRVCWYQKTYEQMKCSVSVSLYTYRMMLCFLFFLTSCRKLWLPSVGKSIYSLCHCQVSSPLPGQPSPSSADSVPSIKVAYN